MKKLDERKEKILAAIVKDYLESAEPVGSRTIWRRHIHSFSPATIRNEMADLEELGYITHPHTSAGRIPTDKGYRYYVDHLMQRLPLPQKEQEFINKEFRRIHHDVEEILHQSLKILTSLSSYTAVIIIPSVYKSAIKIVQMVLLNLQQIMVVLLTNTGSNNLVLEIPNAKELDLRQNDLNRMSNLLTQKLSGTTLDHIDNRLTAEILLEMPQYKTILNKVVKLIQENLNLHCEDKVYSAGISNMLRQPEYIDVEQMRHILSVVEHDQLLAEIFREYLNSQGITIKIGSENKLKEMKAVSVVATSYEIDGIPAGTIGILGPTRMRYEHTSILLDDISERIQASLLED